MVSHGKLLMALTRYSVWFKVGELTVISLFKGIAMPRPSSKPKPIVENAMECVIPVSTIAKLLNDNGCHIHSSTLQRKIKQSKAEWVVANVDIDGFSFGQPRLLISEDTARRLIRATRNWDVTRSSEEIEATINTILEELGIGDDENHDDF